MRQTITTADLVADMETNEPIIVRATPTIDGWLSAVWGIRPDTSFPRAPAPVTYAYPAEIAEWLSRMWGIPLAEVATTPEIT
jgi:hypothetical protein